MDELQQQVIQLQSVLFTKMAELLNKNAEEIKELKKRVTELENAQLNNPDAIPTSSTVGSGRKEGQGSGEPAKKKPKSE